MKKTKTTKTKKFISVSIESDGRSDNTFAKLSNGTSLGLVQSINWTCNVGESARCQITTLLTKVQLSALMEDSVIRYRLIDDAESDKSNAQPVAYGIYPRLNCPVSGGFDYVPLYSFTHTGRPHFVSLQKPDFA